MIIPSIDLMDGTAVQLRRGRERVLDAGDPLPLLEKFAVAGEVAVIDLDAALGQGSNATLIREMVRRAPCRVGGGIRDLETAVGWLDVGAEKVILGTAASPELCSALPRTRVLAAVDAERGEVVVEGWRTRTNRAVTDVVAELAPHVGGFLLTQVEHEGLMGGFDGELIERVLEVAGDARVTAAGGVTTAGDVAHLDHIGVDAQVGMALYSGRLALGDAIAAPLRDHDPDTLWPTVICDEDGSALGLAWSTRESLRQAVESRRGVYWSRSREALWVKGETSGNTQTLRRVDLDCDRDALRFVVRQHGAGFCHRGTRTCWRDEFTLDALARVIRQRAETNDPASGTAQLFRDAALLESKLREEADELARAEGADEAVREAADVIYFLLAQLSRWGVSLADVRAELERRSRQVTRRPMAAKHEPSE